MNSLEGVIQGIIQGSLRGMLRVKTLNPIIGLIKGSLDPKP